MYVCASGSEHLLCAYGQVCRLSRECSTKGFSQPLSGSAGASDPGGRWRVGVRHSSHLPSWPLKVKPDQSPPLTPRDIQHLSVEAEHIFLRAYSDSLLVLLLCLPLLPPLFSLLLKVCSFPQMHIGAVPAPKFQFVIVLFWHATQENDLPHADGWAH